MQQYYSKLANTKVESKTWTMYLKSTKVSSLQKTFVWTLTETQKNFNI